ncbi:MAG: delta-60 repeat domain-containing protein [Verrucomicrobiota bacterium]
MKTRLGSALLALAPCLSLFGAAAPASAQGSGSLDTAFNPTVSGGVGTVTTTAVLPDGKMIIGGSFTMVAGMPHKCIARLNADGSVDASFTASTNDIVLSVAVQADGKLVLGGFFTSVNGSTVSETTGVNRITRLNADGTRDTAFNTSGSSGLGGANGSVYSVAVQADGKLVLGGQFTSVNGSLVSATAGVNSIARLNADGTRDTAFASGGTQLGGPDHGVVSVAVQADGRRMAGWCSPATSPA